MTSLTRFRSRFWLLGFRLRWCGQSGNTRPAKTNVTESDGQQTVHRNRDGARTMFEQFGSIEVAVTGVPSRRNVCPIGKYAKVRDEPHPVTLYNDGQNNGCENADN